MPKITIDGVDYNTEDLSDNGKAQLASLQFLEVQMNKIKLSNSAFQKFSQFKRLRLRSVIID